MDSAFFLEEMSLCTGILCSLFLPAVGWIPDSSAFRLPTSHFLIPGSCVPGSSFFLLSALSIVSPLLTRATKVTPTSPALILTSAFRLPISAFLPPRRAGISGSCVPSSWFVTKIIVAGAGVSPAAQDELLKILVSKKG